jgi:hypothetical protein
VKNDHEDIHLLGGGCAHISKNRHLVSGIVLYEKHQKDGNEKKGSSTHVRHAFRQEYIEREV